MISFPWTSISTGLGENGYPIYDRHFGADEWAEIYETFFSYGVFLNDNIHDSTGFVVTASDGMTINVQPGYGHIRGRFCREPNVRKLQLQAAGSKDRIDTVVLRWDTNIEARKIDLYVVNGAESDSPTRPNLTRSESVYELGICDIYIPKNTTTISNSRITDTRLDNARCGVVTPFDEINTTTFYNQIQAAIDEHIAELQEQTDRAVELAQDALDGTVAGNLQNQVDGKVSKSGDTMTGSLYIGENNSEEYKELAITRQVGSINARTLVATSQANGMPVSQLSSYYNGGVQNQIGLYPDKTFSYKPIEAPGGTMTGNLNIGASGSTDHRELRVNKKIGSEQYFAYLSVSNEGIVNLGNAKNGATANNISIKDDKTISYKSIEIGLPGLTDSKSLRIRRRQSSPDINTFLDMAMDGSGSAVLATYENPDIPGSTNELLNYIRLERSQTVLYRPLTLASIDSAFFSCRGNANVAVGTAISTLAMNTNVYSYGSGWAYSGGGVRIPRNGFYLISASCYVDHKDDSVAQLFIYHNDNEVASVTQLSDTTAKDSAGAICTSAYIAYCSAGHVIYMKGRCRRNPNRNFLLGNASTRLNIVQLY